MAIQPCFLHCHHNICGIKGSQRNPKKHSGVRWMRAKIYQKNTKKANNLEMHNIAKTSTCGDNSPSFLEISLQSQRSRPHSPSPLEGEAGSEDQWSISENGANFVELLRVVAVWKYESHVLVMWVNPGCHEPSPMTYHISSYFAKAGTNPNMAYVYSVALLSSESQLRSSHILLWKRIVTSQNT